MGLIKVRWNPSLKELRVFALLQLAFFAIVAWLLHRHFAATSASWSLLAVSAVLAVSGLARPALLRPVYVGWMAAAFPIGWLVSHTLMALIYYLLITPSGLLMRLLGRDPLERRFDRSAQTYWKARPPQNDMARYFRQY